MSWVIAMPSAYSNDLRHKAITALATHHVDEVSAMFDIHRATLNRWKRKVALTGEVEAKENYQKGHSHKIGEAEAAAFHAFVAEHGDKTQAQMAQLWPDEISEATIGRMLKRFGYTRKKRVTATKSATKPTAESSVWHWSL